MEQENKSRGKRRFAIAISVYLGLLGVWGIYNEEAQNMAKFFAPFIVPLVGGLYLGDGYFANQRMLRASKYSGRRSD